MGVVMREVKKMILLISMDEIEGNPATDYQTFLGTMSAGGCSYTLGCCSIVGSRN